MVAHLLRLKLALLRNALRRSVWVVVGLVLGGLYGLGLLAGAMVGLVALAWASADLTRAVLVLAGGGAVLGWWVVPLVAFGIDETLDPRRFATFAVPRRDMLVGLALAALVGVPGAVTVVLALGTVASWAGHGAAAVPAALVGAALGVATCVVGARATTTVFARVASSRRFREVAGVVAFLPIILLGPIITTAVRGLSAAGGELSRLADWVGWTPVGAPWAIPADVADGAWAAAAVKVLVAVATVAVLGRVWSSALERSLVNPPSVSRAASRGSGGLGPFGWLPATPTGAVAARCLVYWLRDPRYAGSLVIVPLMPVILYFAGGASWGPLLALGPITAFLLGWATSADVAYDSTAFWAHLSAGVSGLADRGGRLVASAVLGVPITVVFTVASVAVSGRWHLLPALLGIAVGILATSYGAASVASALLIVPVPAPGQSPFASPPGGGMTTLLTQFAGFAAVAGATAPELVLGIVAIATGSAAAGWAALAVGTVLGAALLVVGLRAGARTYDRRAPALLQQMVAAA